MSEDDTTPSFPFIIDRLTEEDIPSIVAIERRVFSMPWTPGIYRYELRHNRFARYLGIRSKSPALPPLAGYAGAWLYLPEAHISTIAVDPGLRGLHLGAWLLACLLVDVADEGAQEATLEVRVSNRVAQGLYLSFGFRVAGRRYRYYSDNREDAYVMTLAPLDPEVLRWRRQQEEATARRLWTERGATVVQVRMAHSGSER